MTAVIAVAVIAAVLAAGSTRWRLSDLGLLTLLCAFGAIAGEMTRQTSEPAGPVKDVYGIWQLPIALLLPPVYSLVAPVLTIVVLRLRTRATIAHRQFFSAAASGLALAAASLLFGWLRTSRAVPVPGTADHTMMWLAAAAGCALMWSVTGQGLIIMAVRLSDPAISLRQLMLSTDSLLTDLCEMGTGLLLAAAVAAAGWPVLIPALPLVILVQRSIRYAQLRSEARLDDKTGLLTAAAWREEATVALAQARRSGSSIALAIADLDHFKAVNDTWGHLVGDAVLAAAADSLAHGVRPGDLIGRFGGEEFVFCLPGATTEQAVAIADRLRERLAELSVPAGAGGEPVTVTASIGLAATPSPQAAGLTELLAAADAALYRAKNSGRNATRLTSV